MPECPHLSKNQIDKILNCQDSFLGKMQELDKVVKKLNTAALQLEADFLHPPEVAANYQNKKKNQEAAEKANKEVDEIKKEYLLIEKTINENIEHYNTLLNYQTNMYDLEKYYYKTIDKDKDQIEKIKSKKAIAQRMASYYKDKTDSVSWYNYYLKYFYWAILISIGILFVYLLSGKFKHIAFAIITNKCRNINVENKNNSGGNWVMRFCKKISNQNKSKERTPNVTNNICGIKSTAFLLFLLIFTPHILIPTITFLKPYLYPYA